MNRFKVGDRVVIIRVTTYAHSRAVWGIFKSMVGIHSTILKVYEGVNIDWI